MQIKLKVDYNGEPYLELVSDGKNTEDELLEVFIRKACRDGIVIKNEADMDTRNDYASIRLLSRITPEGKRRVGGVDKL